MRVNFLFPLAIVCTLAPAVAQPSAMSDASFVTAAAMSDMYEIQAGKLAQNLGQSAGVRQFGAQMIDAHTRTSMALKAAAASSGGGMQPPPALDARHQAMLDGLSKAGPGFDAAYVNDQMAAHQEALSLMEGYNASGSNPALRTFAQQTAPIIQQHIAMLQSLRAR